MYVTDLSRYILPHIKCTDNYFPHYERIFCIFHPISLKNISLQKNRLQNFVCSPFRYHIIKFFAIPMIYSPNSSERSSLRSANSTVAFRNPSLSPRSYRLPSNSKA